MSVYIQQALEEGLLAEQENQQKKLECQVHLIDTTPGVICNRPATKVWNSPPGFNGFPETRHFDVCEGDYEMLERMRA